jgi:hypothetical protein
MITVHNCRIALLGNDAAWEITVMPRSSKYEGISSQYEAESKQFMHTKPGSDM